MRPRPKNMFTRLLDKLSPCPSCDQRYVSVDPNGTWICLYCGDGSDLEPHNGETYPDLDPEMINPR